MGHVIFVSMPSGKVSVFLRPEERHLSEICRASATFAAMVRSRGSCGFVTAVVTLVVALACFPQTVSGLYADDSQVVSLDPKSFKAKVTNDVQSFYLVEFYAPWCGHCKKLAPEYEAAARAIKKEKAPATLAAVDCDKHKALCDTHGVSGFPTILSFSAGREKASKGEKYEGARDKDGIVEFVTLKSAAKPSVDDLLAPRLPYADVHSFLHHGDSSIPKAVLLTEGVASGEYFPITTFRLPDCPYSYQKGLFSLPLLFVHTSRYTKLTLSFVSYQGRKRPRTSPGSPPWR